LDWRQFGQNHVENHGNAESWYTSFRIFIVKMHWDAVLGFQTRFQTHLNPEKTSSHRRNKQGDRGSSCLDRLQYLKDLIGLSMIRIEKVHC